MKVDCESLGEGWEEGKRKRMSEGTECGQNGMFLLSVTPHIFIRLYKIMKY